MKKVLLFAVISALIVSISITSISAQSQEVPSWIKNNAGWWAEGTIDDIADMINKFEKALKMNSLQE